MLQQGSAFNGFSIEASDGRIGTVSDFLFDDSTWKLRWLVVDTGTWLENRKILLHPSSIEKADVPAHALLVRLTQDEVRKSPAIATDAPVSMQLEYDLYGHYGVDPQWAGQYYGWNAVADPVIAPSDRAGVAATVAGLGSKGDPHLRSIKEVTGYKLHASDGPIGHVENLLFDDAAWDVKYLVGDTRNWWFGQHVLLSPASVKEIDWNMRNVRLDLTCYKIKGSPPWHATGVLDRAYEQLLQAYYKWPNGAGPENHRAGVKDIAAE